MGGSPLNNEVWRLDTVKVVPRLVPTTRALYLNTTHVTSWTFLGNADWAPRAGMNVVSQWYVTIYVNTLSGVGYVVCLEI